MQSVRKSGPRQAPAIAWLAIAVLALRPMPAAAFDLFARHQVTVQFATADGKPMANAEVRVYAPHDAGRVAQTGHTDKDGKFEFPADSDGMWRAEARDGSEVASATIRVGKPPAPGDDKPLSPYYLVAALGVLLALALWVRFLRRRTRARRR